MVRVKYRFRFRKSGDLRWISHHDLMRCFERMLRRAAIPFTTTKGFNPKPRMVFALPLPLGIAGLDEVVELELDEDLPLEQVLSRLRAQAPSGLEFMSGEAIPPRTTAHVRQVTYRVPVPSEPDGGLTERIAGVMAQPNCWVQRHKPTPRKMDLRPYLAAFRLVDLALEMDFLVTPQGTPRPDEVLSLLGLTGSAGGALVERIKLELDEGDAVLAPSSVDQEESTFPDPE